jgi:SAM-dependent methyltransferase
MSTIIRTTTAQLCCDSEWEAAYRRFETPEEEIRKFVARLNAFGASSWPKYDQIVEIFCGRGNGLKALKQLGFQRLEGVDLSEKLLLQYEGDAQCYVADCRNLPFEDGSRDVVIVQGGMHHLPLLPDDLNAVLKEVHRVLRPGGRFYAVEPWRTPFLTFVHFVSERSLARRLWDKLDALAVMTEHERTTYEQWLGRGPEILSLLDHYFVQNFSTQSWGKLRYAGVRRD